MKFEKYITEKKKPYRPASIDRPEVPKGFRDMYKERGKNKPTSQQTKVLKDFLKKDKVWTSYMSGKNMIIGTKRRTHEFGPDGKEINGYD